MVNWRHQLQRRRAPFATILLMLSRRDFARLIATALATPLVTLRAPSIQVLSQSREATPKTSVMMWTLNKSGTLERNLERIAQAGYNHVELVSEFKTWSKSDARRIMAPIHALPITCYPLP